MCQACPFWNNCGLKVFTGSQFPSNKERLNMALDTVTRQEIMGDVDEAN